MRIGVKDRKTKKLLTDTVLFGISSFGSKILVLLLTPFYTMMLSPADYGVADLITTTINFIYPVLTISIAEATLRFAFQKGTSKRNVLNISLAIVFISFLVLILCGPLIQYVRPEIYSYWFIFCFTYLLFNIHNVFLNFIKGLDKTKLFAISGIIQTVVIVVLNLLFLLGFRMGLEGYLLSALIGYVVPIIVVLFAGDVYKYIGLFNFDTKLFKEMIVYSAPMIAATLCWAINTSLDKYMIIHFSDIGQSGIYSVAHKVPSILNAIFTVFSQAWLISAIINTGDKDEAKFTDATYLVISSISIVVTVFIVVLSKWFASWLFASEYFDAWSCIPMLALSATFAGLAGFLAASFRAYKKTKILFITVVIGAAINIVINLILIPRIGIKGAAIATFISFFVIWLLRIIFVQRIVRVKGSMIMFAISFLLTCGAAVITTFEIQYYLYISLGIAVLVTVLNAFPIIKLMRSKKLASK